MQGPNHGCIFRIYRISGSRQLRSWQTPSQGCFYSSLASSPDGKQLAAGRYDGLSIWEVSTGQPMMSISHALFTFAFTPDSRQIVLRDRAFATTLWDIDAGEVLGVPMSSSELQETRDDNFVGLAISPDEKIIATGYPHGKLRLWQNPLAGDWPSAACAVAGRNMTPFEWKLYFSITKYRRTCLDFPDGKVLPSH